MAVGTQNLSFTDSLKDYQLIDYGQSINQDYNSPAIAEYPIAETTAQQYLYSVTDNNKGNNGGNKGNNGNNNNDLTRIIENITKQLQPYQRWLEFFF
jgi:hypothetical protein